MNRNYKYLLMGFATVILALVFMPQGLLEKWGRKYFETRPDNFLLQEIVGRVEKKSQNLNSFDSAGAKSSVHSGDTFITHGDSKALFNFDTPFWLMPYSKMEFLRKEGAWTGHLIYGEIKKLSTLSNNEKIDLVYEGQIIQQEYFSSSQDNIIVTVIPGSDEAFKDLSLGQSAPQNVLEKQIFQTLLLHKKFFQGCLVKYYKTKGGDIRGGESVFDLLIDVTGTLEKASVTKTDISDKEYLDCLKMVFSRIRFKNLPIKEPLHALFPLSVELPQ